MIKYGSSLFRHPFSGSKSCRLRVQNPLSAFNNACFIQVALIACILVLVVTTITMSSFVVEKFNIPDKYRDIHSQLYDTMLRYK